MIALLPFPLAKKSKIIIKEKHNCCSLKFDWVTRLGRGVKFAGIPGAVVFIFSACAIVSVQANISRASVG